MESRCSGSGTECDHLVYRAGLCIFHSPKKSPQAFREAFSKLLAQHHRISPGKELTLEGFIFPDIAMNFDFKENMIFKKCQFMEDADFRNAKLGGSFTWNECTVRRNCWFDDLQLAGETQFEACSFQGDASFRRVTGRVPKKPKYVNSEEPSVGEDTKVPRREDLVGQDSVIFKTCSFQAQTNFAELKNIGKFRLESISFSDTVVMNELEVVKDLTFLGVTFNADVFIHQSILCGECRWDSVTVKGDLVATECIYDADANFIGVTMEGRAFFAESIFGKKANFETCIFTQTASFINSTFHGRAAFLNGGFLGPALFLDTQYHKGVGFESASFLDRAMFSGQKNKSNQPARSNSQQGDTPNSEARELETGANTSFNQIDNRPWQGEISFRNSSFQGYTWFSDIVLTGKNLRVPTGDNSVQGSNGQDSDKEGPEGIETYIDFEGAAFMSEGVIQNLYRLHAGDDGSKLESPKTTSSNPRKAKVDQDDLGRFRFEYVIISSTASVRISQANVPIRRSQASNSDTKDSQSIKPLVISDGMFLNSDLARVQFVGVDWREPSRRRMGWKRHRLVGDPKRRPRKSSKSDGPDDTQTDKKVSYEALADAYRGLRIAYEKNLRFTDAGKFHFEEVDARRRGAIHERPKDEDPSTSGRRGAFHVRPKNWWNRLTSWPRGIMLWFYKLLGRYGESYMIPLFWLFVVVFLFGVDWSRFADCTVRPSNGSWIEKNITGWRYNPSCKVSMATIKEPLQGGLSNVSPFRLVRSPGTSTGVFKLFFAKLIGVVMAILVVTGIRRHFRRWPAQGQ